MGMIDSHLSSSGGFCLADSDDGSEPEPDPNNPPVLSPISPQSLNEGQTLTITLSATDSDGDSLSYSSSALPAGASLSGRTFRFTPANDFVPRGSSSATANVTFTVSDSNGGSDSQAVSITVNFINGGVTLTSIDNTNVFAGDLLMLQFYAMDADGDTITFSSPNLPSGAQLTETGTFSWIPTTSDLGVRNIDIVATDPFGARDTERFSIGVQNSPVGDLPPPPPGEGDTEDFDGDGIPNGSDTDDDNDGVSDNQEALDGSDPFDPSSGLRKLDTTFCTDWNGFVNQLFNIAEINNFTPNDKLLRAQLSEEFA